MARLRARLAERERVETVVVGGGQAGLAVGYHLAQRDLPFVILDANERIGDSWRKRWDSLRLFTPARYNALPGMAFPGPAHRSPPRTRWPTTSRPTPHSSSSRFEPASESIGCPGTAAVSWSKRATALRG